MREIITDRSSSSSSLSSSSSSRSSMSSSSSSSSSSSLSTPSSSSSSSSSVDAGAAALVHAPASTSTTTPVPGSGITKAVVASIAQSDPSLQPYDKTSSAQAVRSESVKPPASSPRPIPADHSPAAAAATSPASEPPRGIGSEATSPPMPPVPTAPASTSAAAAASPSQSPAAAAAAAAAGTGAAPLLAAGAPAAEDDGPTTAPFPNIVVSGKTWNLGKKLGEGSFGEIYAAHPEGEEGFTAAIKLGRGEGRDMLQREARLLHQLRGYDGVPEMYGCGIEADCYFMLMELLGPSLSDIMADYELSLKAVLHLADQMIQHLEYIHSKHMLHGDLKPSNFLLGRGEKCNKVYIIDFGLCEEYYNAETKKHVPFTDKHGFHGTPRYCSIHVHNGIVSSRRDDMESLGYVLLFLLLGKLPWQNLPADENETKKQKRRKIAEMKIHMPVTELCRGLPDEFVSYINITRNYTFKQAPDYYQLRMLFRDLFVRSGFGSYDDDWFSTLPKRRKARRKPRGPKRPGEDDDDGAAANARDPADAAKRPNNYAKKESKWRSFLRTFKKDKSGRTGGAQPALTGRPEASSPPKKSGWRKSKQVDK